MGLKVQVDFLQGGTVRIRAYVYDDDDTLVTPTSVTIDIYDPDDTLTIDGATMDPTATGTYDYFHNTDSDTTKGQWYGTVWVVDGSGDGAKTSYGTFSFKVK